MNRIPVLNDEQRADYGAPTTEIGAGLAKTATATMELPRGEAVVHSVTVIPPTTAAKRPAAKKKPAAKAKAKK